MKNYLILFFSLLLLSSCEENNSNEINIYSKRHYQVDIKQYENFEKLTGIKVNVIKAGDDELLERLKNEGQNSPADLFVTVDAGKLQKGVDMGLFQKIQNVLKPNAKAVIQTITMTEDYFEGYDKWPDFIQTYIFPGGELASDQLFIDEANKFDLENIKTTNFAKSYAKTLETWYENFQIAWGDIEKMGFDAKFKRTWDMYLAYCRGGFLNGQLEVSQYLLKVK